MIEVDAEAEKPRRIKAARIATVAMFQVGERGVSFSFAKVDSKLTGFDKVISEGIEPNSGTTGFQRYQSG